MLNLRATRLRARADAGISLIELVVGMTLMTIIAAVTTVFFVKFQSASDRTTDLNVGSASARNALESWIRMLTLADTPTASPGVASGRFQQITPTSIVFYANSNSNRATADGARTAPLKVALSLENRQLVQRVYAPDSPAAPSTYTGNARVTYLAGNVTTSGWLFAPYVVATPPQLVEPNDCFGAAGLCAGDPAADPLLPTVIRIDLSFTVAPGSGGAQSYSGTANITGGTT